MKQKQESENLIWVNFYTFLLPSDLSLFKQFIIISLLYIYIYIYIYIYKSITLHKQYIIMSLRREEYVSNTRICFSKFYKSAIPVLIPELFRYYKIGGTAD